MSYQSVWSSMFRQTHWMVVSTSSWIWAPTVACKSGIKGIQVSGKLGVKENQNTNNQAHQNHHKLQSPSPPSIHHKVFTTKYSSRSIYHQVFTTKYSPPSIYHRVFTTNLNLGIHRKLYEPHLFPLAPILPLYTKYFGEPEDRKNQVVMNGNFDELMMLMIKIL